MQKEEREVGGWGEERNKIMERRQGEEWKEGMEGRDKKHRDKEGKT